tara:strand:- start:2724 stop:3803 length:1080 start_codon:yes stop_codon:yes gene_type:complete
MTKRIIRPALALIAAMILVEMAAGIVWAQSGEEAPPVSVNEAHAWRNVVDTTTGGDLLIIIRFELPLEVSGSSTLEWCSRLANTEGCSESPPDPEEPATLPLGEANAAFYTDSGLTLKAQNRIPRVGHGLAGVYFAPGHGITWQDVDALACVESSAAFATTTQSCAGLTWENSSTTAQAIENLTGPTTGLIPLMLNLQDARLEALGTFVSSNKITPAGQVFTREAIDGLARVVPGAFAAGATRVFDEDIDAPTGSPALSDTLATAAAGESVPAALAMAAQEYTGLSDAAAGITLTLLLALGAATLGHVITGKNEITAAGGLVMLFLGSLMGYPPIEYLGAVAFIMLVAGGMWFARRQAQ